MTRSRFQQVDDAALVAAIGRRDGAAATEVVRRNGDAVRGFARRLVGDDARAQEISQEVFAWLWERWDRFDESRGSLRSFLLAVTHGRSLDLMRSDAARLRREQRDALSEPAPTLDPAVQVVASDVDRSVRAAVETLSPDDRRALQLAYFDGLSYREVAEVLGEPLGTVKARIRRALIKMRHKLGDVR